MARERRHEPRFTIEQIVEISFGREAFVRASGINISKSGMLCETDGYLEPSTKVALQMSIQLPTGTYRFNCEGVVVRTDEKNGRFLSGISFTSLEAGDTRKLAAFINQQKPASRQA